MEVNAYTYIKHDDAILCFSCAVQQIIEDKVLGHEPDNFDLALEMGSSGDGNDMRRHPECSCCGKYLEDFCIG